MRFSGIFQGTSKRYIHKEQGDTGLAGGWVSRDQGLFGQGYNSDLLVSVLIDTLADTLLTSCHSIAAVAEGRLKMAHGSVSHRPKPRGHWSHGRMPWRNSSQS